LSARRNQKVVDDHRYPALSFFVIRSRVTDSKAPMSSLKGYVPALARHLGISPAALYERQRALVRSGAMDLIEGRGPGSGVRVDCRGIALLLIAVLATDSLSQTEQRVQEIGNAEVVNSPDLSKTFLDTLEGSLLSSALTSDVREIRVSRTAALAWIDIEYDGEIRTLEFIGQQAVEPGLRITATLVYEVFQKITEDAHDIVMATFAERKERHLAEKEERA
jgi:hypothetical protein